MRPPRSGRPEIGGAWPRSPQLTHGTLPREANSDQRPGPCPAPGTVAQRFCPEREAVRRKGERGESPRRHPFEKAGGENQASGRTLGQPPRWRSSSERPQGSESRGSGGAPARRRSLRGAAHPPCPHLVLSDCGAIRASTTAEPPPGGGHWRPRAGRKGT